MALITFLHMARKKDFGTQVYSLGENVFNHYPKPKKLFLKDRSPQTVTSKVCTGASKSLYQARSRTVAFSKKHGTSANRRVFQKAHGAQEGLRHTDSKRFEPLPETQNPTRFDCPKSGTRNVLVARNS